MGPGPGGASCMKMCVGCEPGRWFVRVRQVCVGGTVCRLGLWECKCEPVCTCVEWLPNARPQKGQEGPGSWLHPAQVRSRLASFPLSGWKWAQRLPSPSTLPCFPLHWGPQCSPGGLCSMLLSTRSCSAHSHFIPKPSVCGPWPEFAGTDARSPLAWFFWFCFWPRVVE